MHPATFVSEVLLKVLDGISNGDRLRNELDCVAWSAKLYVKSNFNSNCAYFLNANCKPPHGSVDLVPNLYIFLNLFTYRATT